MPITEGQAPPKAGQRQEIKDQYCVADAQGNVYLVCVYPGYVSVFNAADTSKYGGPGTPIVLPS